MSPKQSHFVQEAQVHDSSSMFIWSSICFLSEAASPFHFLPATGVDNEEGAPTCQNPLLARSQTCLNYFPSIGLNFRPQTCSSLPRWSSFEVEMSWWWLPVSHFDTCANNRPIKVEPKLHRSSPTHQLGNQFSILSIYLASTLLRPIFDCFSASSPILLRLLIDQLHNPVLSLQQCTIID